MLMLVVLTPYIAEIVRMYGLHPPEGIHIAEASLRKGNKVSTLQRAPKDVLVVMCLARTT